MSSTLLLSLSGHTRALKTGPRCTWPISFGKWQNFYMHDDVLADNHTPQSAVSVIKELRGASRVQAFHCASGPQTRRNFYKVFQKNTWLGPTFFSWICNEQRSKWQLEKLPMQRTLLGFGYARRLKGMV